MRSVAILSCLLALVHGMTLMPATARAQSGESAPAAPPTVPATPPASKVDPRDYLIGPGDVLQVFVWRNPELSATVPVRPDGKVSTPLIEDIVAVGKTPSTLARDMETVLAEYVRTPTVNVIVTQPASRFSQVKVVGQVQKPQGLAYREGMTVLDAILEVGGLTPFAAGNRARIVRKEGGKDIEIRIKLNDLMNKGSSAQNPLVKPGDVLVVPESLL
jgi:polysaccharide biosynthesis/export protein